MNQIRRRSPSTSGAAHDGKPGWLFMGVRPAIEVLSPVVDFSADFPWRIQG
jgi:hypothetical protein